MECLIVQSDFTSRGIKPKSSFAAADAFRGAPFNSMFGNSHKCAFTTPSGRWRTRKLPRFSITNAAKRRAVAVGRLSRLGNSFTQLFLNAKQCLAIGHAWHLGSRGVQMSAPSSMSDWL